MIKIYCDLCGKEIYDNQDYSRYKVKKGIMWQGRIERWDNLIVHKKCWENLNTYLAMVKPTDSKQEI